MSFALPGWSQFTLTPRANIPLPVGQTREYGTPRVGYGVEAGYQVFLHWGGVAAYDRYRFGLNTRLENLSINPAIIALLNLPETITLDLTSDTWNVGVRYLATFSRCTSYLGIETSINRIVARGYGISITQRYWGLAPALGAEWAFTSRWSGRLDTRLQTIFIRDDIPFVDQVIDRYLIFIPIQVGIVARLFNK